MKALLVLSILFMTFSGHGQRPVGIDPTPIKNDYSKLSQSFAKIYDSVKSRLEECGVKTKFRNYRTEDFRFTQFFRLISELHLKEGVKVPGDPKELCEETKQLQCILKEAQVELDLLTQDKEIKDFLRVNMKVRPQKVDEVLEMLRMANPGYTGNQLKDG